MFVSFVWQFSEKKLESSCFLLFYESREVKRTSSFKTFSLWSVKKNKKNYQRYMCVLLTQFGFQMWNRLWYRQLHKWTNKKRTCMLKGRATWKETCSMKGSSGNAKMLFMVKHHKVNADTSSRPLAFTPDCPLAVHIWSFHSATSPPSNDDVA